MSAHAVPPAGAVEVAAPAKLNLSLLIGPVRSDGYHEIFSLMVPVTLGDLVTARPAPSGAGLAVICEVAPGEQNLAARMVRAVEARLDRTFDVELTIVKRVPAAAGLGGGSSDAAAALVALERLFGLDLPAKLRYDIAAEVGSDVPFFLWPGPQFAMGRGTVLKEVELPQPLHLVIALPGLALPTSDVYGWRAADGEAEPKDFVAKTQRLMQVVQRARRPRDLAAIVGNDLEGPVVARHPEVGLVVQRLLDEGAIAAAMSGSGSSVFGLFASAASAQRALAALAPVRTQYVTDLQPREERAGRRATAPGKGADPGGAGDERG